MYSDINSTTVQGFTQCSLSTFERDSDCDQRCKVQEVSCKKTREVVRECRRSGWGWVAKTRPDQTRGRGVRGALSGAGPCSRRANRMYCESVGLK